MNPTNQPAWIPIVVRALDPGLENYLLAAETIFEAIEASRRAAGPRSRSGCLTRKAVADLIGHKFSYVSRLLTWYGMGERRDPRGPFVAEFQARFSSKKFPIPTAEDLGQLDLEGGSADWMPGQDVATIQALALCRMCRLFRKMAKNMSREVLAKVYYSGGLKRCAALETLRFELQNARTAADATLGETSEALMAIPRMLEDA
jgi:hypothetical protein